MEDSFYDLVENDVGERLKDRPTTLNGLNFPGPPEEESVCFSHDVSGHQLNCVYATSHNKRIVTFFT